MESRTVAINGASSPLLLVCLNVSRGSDHYLYTSQISRLAVGIIMFHGIGCRGLIHVAKGHHLMTQA